MYVPTDFQSFATCPLSHTILANRQLYYHLSPAAVPAMLEVSLVSAPTFSFFFHFFFLECVSFGRWATAFFSFTFFSLSSYLHPLATSIAATMEAVVALISYATAYCRSTSHYPFLLRTPGQWQKINII